MENVNKEHRNIRLFENVCMIYGRELQRFIYTLTRKDRYAMEEIYQNTMLGALTGLGYLRDDRKMKSWIFSIAKAESKRYYAANRPDYRQSGVAGTEEDCCRLDDMIDFTKSIEDKEHVKALIDCLSEEEQQLYILHYYYDLPLKDISQLLNVNYNTVRSMHIRGMVKMRKQLMQHREAESVHE